MAVHLYGVLEGPATSAPSITGLDGRPVRVLPLGERHAWVSDAAAPRLEATPKRVREHDAVLRAAIEAGYSVVPSLFGRLHADDRSLVATLEQRAEVVDTAMGLVRGRVEMSLLVVPSGSPPSAEQGRSVEAEGA
ncbi:MAG TPA: GvpL/GvpF family gas vesicle protein, partial [Gemmatimonadaceae bacterium]|nr:GvpL/GvpF family gas vesicle protein [Gemmatimonadaceae bacterium]